MSKPLVFFIWAVMIGPFCVLWAFDVFIQQEHAQAAVQPKNRIIIRCPPGHVMMDGWSAKTQKRTTVCVLGEEAVEEEVNE